MSSLSTHVLDTASGKPASSVKIELFSLDGASKTLLKVVETNRDGRTDEPLLSEKECFVGEYELCFHVADYFRSAHSHESNANFLSVVPVRFLIQNEGEHYHVPLLVSPWSYSTYRGS